MRGTVMGGETPIRGANMILWETSSSGYGSSNAKQLATTTTATGGGFSFTTGYTCDSGQFVYITATGGDVNNNPSASITNNNVVLMAALGSCSNFATSGAQASISIAISRLSTVAAWHALDNFISRIKTLPVNARLRLPLAMRLAEPAPGRAGMEPVPLPAWPTHFRR